MSFESNKQKKIANMKLIQNFHNKYKFSEDDVSENEFNFNRSLEELDQDTIKKHTNARIKRLRNILITKLNNMKTNSFIDHNLQSKKRQKLLNNINKLTAQMF
jgi:hypothetical protein